MFKNPFINALLAMLYIVVIVFGIQNIALLNAGKPDSILIPMTMLGLFVLSASIMGLLFVYTPLKMFLEGQKNEGLVFFFKTVGAFACLVAIFGVLLVTL